MGAKRPYLPVIVTVVSGVSLGLFVGELLRKLGHGSTMASAAAVGVFAAAVPAVWLVYSRLLSKLLNADRARFANSDAWSYSPFILTALMLARSQWPVKSLGAILLTCSAALSLWMKAGQLLSYRKGAHGVGRWTYAAPAGFAAALIVQALYAGMDWAMFLVTGQILTLAAWCLAAVAGRAAQKS